MGPCEAAIPQRSPPYVRPRAPGNISIVDPRRDPLRAQTTRARTLPRQGIARVARRGRIREIGRSIAALPPDLLPDRAHRDGGSVEARKRISCRGITDGVEVTR